MLSKAKKPAKAPILGQKQELKCDIWVRFRCEMKALKRSKKGLKSLLSKPVFSKRFFDAKRVIEGDVCANRQTRLFLMSRTSFLCYGCGVLIPTAGIWFRRTAKNPSVL